MAKNMFLFGKVIPVEIDLDPELDLEEEVVVLALHQPDLHVDHLKIETGACYGETDRQLEFYPEVHHKIQSDHVQTLQSKVYELRLRAEVDDVQRAFHRRVIILQPGDQKEELCTV